MLNEDILDGNGYLDQGYWILYASFFFIVGAVAVLFCHVLSIEFTKTHIYVLAVPYGILGFYASFFISDKRKEEKFRQLEEKYKEERFRRLKGWLVFFYLIGTELLFFLCALCKF